MGCIGSNSATPLESALDVQSVSGPAETDDTKHAHKVVIFGDCYSGKTTLYHSIQMMRDQSIDIQQFMNQCKGEKFLQSIYKNMHSTFHKCREAFKANPKDNHLFDVSHRDSDTKEETKSDATIATIKSFRQLLDEANDKVLELEYYSTVESVSNWIEIFDTLYTELITIDRKSESSDIAVSLSDAISYAMDEMVPDDFRWDWLDTPPPIPNISEYAHITDALQKLDPSLTDSNIASADREAITKLIKEIMISIERELQWLIVAVIGQSIAQLWANIPAIKHFYHSLNISYHNYFELSHNLDYFWGRSVAIFNRSYVVSRDDFVRMRFVTSPQSFSISNSPQFESITFSDTSKRSRDREETFEASGVMADMDTPIFMLDLTAFAKKSTYDPQLNAMMESFQSFKEVIKSSTDIDRCILCCNKIDIFKTMLKEGHSLNQCFGDKWDTARDYASQQQNSDEKSDETLNQCVETAIDFIVSECEKMVPSDRTVLITCHKMSAVSESDVNSLFTLLIKSATSNRK